MWRPAEVKARLRVLAVEYGPLALVVWFSVFGLTFASVAALVHLGLDWPWLTEQTGGAGPLVAAYAVTKLLTPVRVAVVAAILPAAARVRDRLRS